jgi:uncharacterized protein (DUF58 family)
MIVLLMILGAGIVIWLLQTLYRRYWDSHLTAEIEFSTNHAVKGEKVELIEVVSNMKRLPLPYINVKFQISKSLQFVQEEANSSTSDYTYRNDIFSLMFYQRITRRIPLCCQKRGVFRIDKMDIVSTGAFMNEVLVTTESVDQEIVVYPAIANADGLEVPFNKICGIIERNKRIYEDKFVFRGIRDYQSYDAMNTINWKASARMGDLMVNQYNESVSQQIVICLNVEPVGMVRYDELSEEAISIAAGLTQKLIEHGIQTALICNGRDTNLKSEIHIESGAGLSHNNTINTALARIDLNLPQRDFGTLLLENDGDEENILYIMISTNTREDLQRDFQTLVRDKEALWIVPKYKDMKVDLSACSAAAYMWEVDKYV